MTNLGQENPAKNRFSNFVVLILGVLFVFIEWWLNTGVVRDKGVQAILFFLVMPCVMGAIIGFFFPGRLMVFNGVVFLNLLCVFGMMFYMEKGGLPPAHMLFAGALIGSVVVGVIGVSGLLGEILEMVLRKRRQQ